MFADFVTRNEEMFNCTEDSAPLDTLLNDFTERWSPS
jgi:hypothetical protein